MAAFMGNAMWGGGGSDAESIERTLEWCRRMKVNKILDGTGMIDQAHDRGIEVHATIAPTFSPIGERAVTEHPDWLVVDRYGNSNAKAPHARYGKGYLADLGKQEVRDNWVHRRIEEIFTRFPEVDGLHLDYIRYQYGRSLVRLDVQAAGYWGNLVQPGDQIWIFKGQGPDPREADFVLTYYVTEVDRVRRDPPMATSVVMEREYSYCFCDTCLANFQERKGVAIPAQLRTTKEKADWILAEHADSWYDFRADNITTLVQDIRDQIKGFKATAKLSAAVFYTSGLWSHLEGKGIHPELVYPHLGQDWIRWCREGLLDFVNPMDYWIPPEEFGQVVAYQVGQLQGACPLYSGILTSMPDYYVKKEDVRAYLSRAQDAGANGITFFNYGSWSSPDYGYDQVLEQSVVEIFGEIEEA